MSELETIIKLAKENNGTVTSAMITAHGISRGNLKYLADQGKLECVSRGVYILPETLEDEFLTLQTRFKKGIYSGESALFLWDLTDQTPIHYSMTFPSTYNTSSPKRSYINCKQVIDEYYNLGKTTIRTPAGHEVACYNMEKTLCDILKPRANTDIQVISEAFKRYVKKGNKNIPLLSEYAKKMGVENRVRTYLEVLL